MAATATAEKERKTRAVKTCHLERLKRERDGEIEVDIKNSWYPVKTLQHDPVPFAGETEAKKYVIDNGLIGTFRCVWTGAEFVAEEKKRVSIK